jgi:hypothetical protein
MQKKIPAAGISQRGRHIFFMWKKETSDNHPMQQLP